jgi:hypothetical protein
MDVTAAEGEDKFDPAYSLPWTKPFESAGSAFTDAVHRAEGQGFYKIKV